ncbi:Protein rcc2 [Homalodisca vitripennis]|nr:Protein rcc2 [Homalodisca vitripennis]
MEIVVTGRNEKGQLGTGNTDRSDVPVELEELKDLTIVGAACGRNHTLFLTDRGHVYACGDNKMGQCGVGSTSQTVDKPTRIRYKGPPIVKVACGAEFSMILDCKGSLYSFGSPEYGQLGHNTTGEYIQQSGKVNHSSEKSPKMIMHFIEKNKDHITPVEGVDIRDVACGTNHTRICIKFCHSASEAITMIRKVYGDVSMGDTQIKEWFRRFKNGRISVESDDRSGRPETLKMFNVFEQQLMKTVD